MNAILLTSYSLTIFSKFFTRNFYSLTAAASDAFSLRTLLGPSSQLPVHTLHCSLFEPNVFYTVLSSSPSVVLTVADDTTSCDSGMLGTKATC